MRRRSPTNSRKYEDLEFRHAFMFDHPIDQIARYFPGSNRESVIELPGERVIVARYDHPSNDPHHLAGGANGADRWDVLSNLVAVSRVTHRWCEMFREDGMALCLYAKLQDDEIVWQELRGVFGLTRPGASVAEFIGRKGFEHDWIVPLWETCVEAEQIARAA